MFGGLAVIFLTGAITVFHGGFTWQNVLEMAVAGLVALEHRENGNTNSTS